MYQKQFKIPEAHQIFIEATLDEWLKLEVVKRSNSLYNSPLFCVPKKTRVSGLYRISVNGTITLISICTVWRRSQNVSVTSAEQTPPFFQLWTSLWVYGKCNLMNSLNHSLHLPFLVKANIIGSPHQWAYWAVQPVFNSLWRLCSETSITFWSTLMMCSFTLQLMTNI